MLPRGTRLSGRRHRHILGAGVLNASRHALYALQSAMRKTSVYLSDEEVEGLRRVAKATGRSQAELIREGIRHVLLADGVRRFHSMGKGHGGGRPYERWDENELHRAVMGR